MAILSIKIVAYKAEHTGTMSNKNKRKRKQKQKGKQKRRAPLNTSRQIRNRNKMGQLVMKHREFLMDISGDSEESIEINPGLAAVFPWLSTIATGFEQYNWNFLKFQFVPTVSATKPGLIALCPDFDPDDNDDPMVKRDFYQFAKTTRDSVWKGVNLHLGKRDLQKRKNLYVRLGVEEQERFTDALHLWVITSGVGDQSTVGELWVEYEVILQTPQISSDVSMPQQTVFKTSDYEPGFATTYPWLADNGTSGHKVSTQGSRAATVYPDTINGTKYYFPEPGYYTLDVSVLAEQLNAVPWDAMTLTGGELLQAEGQQGSGFFEQVLGFLVDNTASETNPAFVEWVGPTADALVDIGVWVADTALPVLTNFFGHFFEAGIPFIVEKDENGAGRMKFEKITENESDEEEEEEERTPTESGKRRKRRTYKNFTTTIKRNGKKEVISMFCAYNSAFAEKWKLGNARKLHLRNRKNSRRRIQRLTRESRNRKRLL